MLNFISLVVLSLALTSTLIDASKFGDDLKYSPSGFCDALKDRNYNIDDEFPELQACFRMSSISTSVRDDLCGRCKEITINASQYIVAKCGIKAPSKEVYIRDAKQYNYYQWADKEGVELICKKEQSVYGTTDTCAGSIMKSKTYIDNSKAKSKGKCEINKKDKEKICHPCIHDIYNKYSASPNSLPSAYFTALSSPEEYFKDFKKFCIENK